MKATLLLLSTLAIGALLMEFGVRLLNLHEPLIWAPHAEFGWKPIPGAERLYTGEGYGQVKINSHGYRDRPRTVVKQAATTRIGIFGDSQTEAIQVHLDETYHYLLQEMLDTQSRPVEVLNFGVTGYSPAQILLTLQQEIDRWDLDIIVVSFFLDNDVSGSIPKLSVSTTGTPFLVTGHTPVRFDYSRSEHSHREFFQEPKYTIRKYSGLYRFIFKLKNSFTRCGSNCSEQPIPTRYALYLEQPPEIWHEAWQVFDETVLEIKRLADSKDKTLIFMSIPAGQTINRQAWDNILAQHPAMRDESWNLLSAEQRFADFAQAHDITLVTAASHFAEKAKTTQLHFGNVGHLTREGHQEMANVAYPALSAAVIEDYHQ